MRRVIWNSWKSIGKLKNMKNQSFEVLCHKQIRNARRGSKEKSAMKHSRWQSCKPLLEYLMESNLCILYVVSKLRKSTIQCFKQFAIQSWNEGVTAIGSRSLQPEGQFRRAAKSQEDGCEISLWLRNGVLHAAKFRSPLARLWNSPEASRYLRPKSWDFLL